MVAWTFVEICCPIMWWITEENRSVSDLPINMPDPVNDLAKPPILLPQVGNLSFTVCKIHVMHLPLILCKVIVSFIAYIPETAGIPEIFEQRA